MEFGKHLYRLGTRIEKRWPRLGTRILASASYRIGERELELLPTLANRSRLAVDIGANWGVYSWRLAKMGVRVVAFEANPTIAARLARAIPAIRVEACALGNRDGMATLHIPRMTNGALATGLASIHAVDHPETAEFEVPIRRLDDLGLSNVGFVKIDVEGAEVEVVSGGLSTITRDRPNLLIEATHGRKTLDQLIAILTPLGYEVRFYRDRRLEPVSKWSDELLRGERPYTNFVFIAQR